jgi:hypothetical protein
VLSQTCTSVYQRVPDVWVNSSKLWYKFGTRLVQHCLPIHLVHAWYTLVHARPSAGDSVERCGVDAHQISGSSLVIYFGATL